MTFAIAPTDLDWFETLRRESLGRIVNFWTPTPWNIAGLNEGDRLYFMLKSPIRKIGGYGFFLEYHNMSASEAWRKWGLANGVYDFSELVERTQKYAEKYTQSFSASNDPEIGCIILSDPVAFDEHEFFQPEDYGFSFAKQVVKIKYFTQASEIPHILPTLNLEDNFQLVDADATKKRGVVVKERVGQSVFRRTILDAYDNRCAITGSKIVEVLQAAHIQPYVNEKSNHVKNGICLRVDLHRLFDEGLITINDDYTIRVSANLSWRSDAYGNLENKALEIPKDPRKHPSKSALARHRSTIFIG